MSSKPKTITVEGVRGASGEVLVWDRDPEQLEGDRMVYQGGTFEVVETEAIKVAIADGRIRAVKGRAETKPDPDIAEDDEASDADEPAEQPGAGETASVATNARNQRPRSGS